MDKIILRNIQVRVGQIYNVDGNAYRLFFVSGDIIGAIAMDRDEIITFDHSQFLTDVQNGVYLLEDNPENCTAYALTEKQRARIERLKPIMDKLMSETYPAWHLITKSGATIHAVDNASEEAMMGKRNFRRRLYAYLRSGCDEMSLVDGRSHRHPKTQRTADNIPSQELVSTEQCALEYALRTFKEILNAKEAHLEMVTKYYSQATDTHNNLGQLERVITADPNAPSYSTVYRYISKHLGGQTITAFCRGEKENRNNHRLLTGNQQSGIVSIGQHMQLDEWESPVDLIDSDGNVLGKAVVYCAFESYAQIIVGLYIGLVNNAIEGLTNLFISMLEPHINQTAPYGVVCTNENFPSCLIPKHVSTDQGAEYMSNFMERFAYDLGIVQSPAPAASGSYKGGVENVFHRLQTRVKSLLLQDGYIEATHDGPKKAQQTACLTIDEFRKIVYRLVIELNTTSLGKKFIPARELIENAIPPVPSEIWKFELSRNFNPITVTDDNRIRYLFALLFRDKKFTIDRSGIQYKKLRYFVDEPWFRQTVTAKKAELDIRYNPTDITYVYVKSSDTIHYVPLAQSIDQYRSYKGMSWKAYDELMKEYDALRVEQRAVDINIQLTTRAQNKQTVDEARKVHGAIINNGAKIKEARAMERARLQIDTNEPRSRLLDMSGDSPQAIGDHSAQAEIPSELPHTITNKDLIAALVDDE